MPEFDIDIRNFAFGGEAYGVLPSGKGCFVRGAAPGENVRVRVTEEHARFVRAELVAVNRPGPARIKPLCPLAGICPGCSCGHITREEEIFWKQVSFERFLLGTGVVKKEQIQSPCTGNERFFWRNKIKLAVENGVAGYRGEDNISLIPVTQCMLVNPEINRSLQQLELPESGSIELRFTPVNGVIRLTEKNRDDIIFDTLPGWGDFPVPAGAFFQTNPEVASLLVHEVVEKIRQSGMDQLVELHCGAGIFSLCAAQKISGLTTVGAEITANSISCAKQAAKRFKLQNRCRFFNADAAAFYSRENAVPLLLVDPPRSGLDKKLLNRICSKPPRYMIYVSCGPDTLQRDIKKLASSGAKVLSARMFDMFPVTAHFESVTFLKWD